MIKKYIKKAPAFLANLLVWVFSISCIFPFIWLIYSSLKTTREFSLNIISLPASPQINNYLDLISGSNMYNAFLNSIFLSFVSVFFIIVISFITAYCLSRFEFRGRKLIYIFFLSGMLIPQHSLLIPIFIFFRDLGLYNTRITLLFPYIAFGLPMSIFLIESFIHSIPIEIEEAAIIDGSSIFTRLFSIILPICKPVLSTAIILSFLNSWNEFPFALVLTRSRSLQTIPLWLSTFTGRYSTNYPQLMAALVMASIPVIIIYIAFSKRVVQGMTAGAVKG